MSDHEELLYRYLGKLSYSYSIELQEKIRLYLESDDSVNVIGIVILLTHNPVITLGRFGNESNILISREKLQQMDIEFHRVDRGGDATYHGEGQLVCYPILNLRKLRISVRKYIYSLERAVISFLSHLGVESHRKGNSTGVWVGDKKIASMGVRVKGRITMHGVAININNDCKEFDLINPCGMTEIKMTSYYKLTGRVVDLATHSKILANEIASQLGLTRKRELSAKEFFILEKIPLKS